jgi:hypothetical protein
MNRGEPVIDREIKLLALLIMALLVYGEYLSFGVH